MNDDAPMVLAILDGFGLAAPDAGNAITPETAPVLFSWMDSSPFAPLTAHGEAVGLFPGQAGNSEAGHLCIGSGRIVQQDLPRISAAIEDGTFQKNTAFLEVLWHVQEHQSRVHLLGLLTGPKSGHACFEHLIALIAFYRSENVRVYLHLFTDGRDSSPHEASSLLQQLHPHLDDTVSIATMTGRYWAMDRNKEWDRTQAAYELLTEGVTSCHAKTAGEAITQAYNRGETDEELCPTLIDQEGLIRDRDGIVFFNARSDRARQICKAFVQENFEARNHGGFPRHTTLENLRVATLSEYGPDLDHVLTAFPSPVIDQPLAQAIGESRPQLYLSETEKYAHVTYFMNGGRAEAVNGERRVVIRSEYTDDLENHPHMSGKKLVDMVLQELETHPNAFICVNFPHPDMVAHTGDLDATKRAVSFVDQELSRLAQELQKVGGLLIVTGDHGNAEVMINPETQEVQTSHTTNPVPFLLIGDSTADLTLRSDGSLADIAPTILALLNLPIPPEMTGTSLIDS